MWNLSDTFRQRLHQVKRLVRDSKARRSVEPVTLRSFPFPYRSAIAISNDCDFMAWEMKLPLYRFLCGEDGLKLDVSDSLFFYVTNALCHSSFSYFQGTSDRPMSYAPILREMNRAGYLDAIHAYGDFDDGSFRRALAERVVEECSREGLKFDIWSNHGSDRNHQNLGHRNLTQYQQGDNPASRPYYHLDLLRQTGVRYFWVDGSYVEAPCQPASLLYRVKARDESWLTLFRRYRGLVGNPAPNAESLPEQIRIEDIDAVIEQEQVCIYYQHLGCWRKTADGRFEANRPPFFSTEGIRVLEHLSDAFHTGRCLVTTTARLLRYLETRDVLRFAVQDDAIVLWSAEEQLSAADLGGVTFYAPGAERMRLMWREKSGAITVLPSKAFFDHTRHQTCIGIPWERLGGFLW